jgi:uncharacterized membrane protein HdeD (DUF308 family)
MITFGYKNRFSGLLRALVALAVGIVMVVSKTDAMVLVVQIVSAFVFLSGLVSLFIGYKHRKENHMPLLGVNGVVNLIIAGLAFAFAPIVAGIVVYLIGFVLLGFGLFQLIALGSASRVMNLGVMAFVMPVLVLLAGAFLLARPAFLGTAVGTVAGVALIIYGLSELLSSFKMKKAMDEYDIQHPQPQEKPSTDEGSLDDVKDVEYEKVDEQ